MAQKSDSLRPGSETHQWYQYKLFDLNSLIVSDIPVKSYSKQIMASLSLALSLYPSLSTVPSFIECVDCVVLPPSVANPHTVGCCTRKTPAFHYRRIKASSRIRQLGSSLSSISQWSDRAGNPLFFDYLALRMRANKCTAVTLVI